MGHHTTLFTILIGIAALVSGCATPIQQPDRWVVVETQNFEIASTMSAEAASELAVELERFKALIHTVTTAPNVESPVPTRIVAFKRKSEFSDFRSESGVAGYFSPGLRENQVALVDWSSKLDATTIIFHEYVHFVLRNGTSINYPLWFDEGFAEVLSTATMHEGRLIVGALPRARIDAFRFGRWLPMKRIIEATSYDDVKRPEKLAMFYAEAWALAHYVSLDLPGAGPAALAEYIERLEQDEAPVDAYEATYGEPIGRSGMIIRKKLEKGDWRLLGVPLDKLPYDRSPPAVRTPSSAEIAIRLGQLQLARGEAPKAQVLFSSALTEEPTNSRAQAGMGDSLKFQGGYEAAEPHFRRAVELGPDDALNHLDLAEHLHELATKQPKGERRSELLDEARDAYRTSLELDAGIPETHLMLGRTYLEAGEDPRASIVSIERAYRALPAHPATITALAEAYVATDRAEAARMALKGLTATRKGDFSWENVDEAIESIREQRKAALEAYERPEGS